jgi:transcription elongation factor GreA
MRPAAISKAPPAEGQDTEEASQQMPRVPLTREGRRELERELKRLEAERPTITEHISRARDQGNDPTENLDLRDAVESLMRIETRIHELNAVLAAAEPLATRRDPSAGAELGATVTVRLQDGEEATYMLVSPAEAAPRRGRLSVESPIGRALLSTKPGDHVVAETPNGPEALDVLHVA